MPRLLRIALFGCGTVGSEVARVLLCRAQELAISSGVLLRLDALVSRSTHRLHDLPDIKRLQVGEVEQVLANPDIDVVVELLGGDDLAYRVVSGALRAGKHVVTANKLLLVNHGAELFPLAIHQRLCLLFEASCGGGIPLIATLQQGLQANRIHHFRGILNGTCNFILSHMDQGMDFQAALAGARRQGLVEENPELDLSGSDTVHKLALLAELSYGCRVDYRHIPVIGLAPWLRQHLPLWRVLLQRSRLSLRLIASARWQGDRLALSVSPTLLPLHDPLASLEGANNALLISSDLLGDSLYTGAGAGGRATASAVLADLLSLGQETAQALWRHQVRLPGFGVPARLVAEDRLEQPYACLLRFRCGHSLPAGDEGRLLCEEGGWSLLTWPVTTRRYVKSQCQQWQSEGRTGDFYLFPYLPSS